MPAIGSVLCAIGAASMLLLASCAAAHDTGGDSARAPASVTGSVRAGPTCPVVLAGEPCRPAPVEQALVELVDAGSVVASTRTDATGSFRLPAEPGTFRIRATATDGLPSTTARAVTVTGGPDRPIKLLLDTGIR